MLAESVRTAFHSHSFQVFPCSLPRASSPSQHIPSRLRVKTQDPQFLSLPKPHPHPTPPTAFLSLALWPPNPILSAHPRHPSTPGACVPGRRVRLLDSLSNRLPFPSKPPTHTPLPSTSFLIAQLTPLPFRPIYQNPRSQRTAMEADGCLVGVELRVRVGIARAIPVGRALRGVIHGSTVPTFPPHSHSFALFSRLFPILFRSVSPLSHSLTRVPPPPPNPHAPPALVLPSWPHLHVSLCGFRLEDLCEAHTGPF